MTRTRTVWAIVVALPSIIAPIIAVASPPPHQDQPVGGNGVTINQPTPEQQAAIAAALGLPPGTQIDLTTQSKKVIQTAGSKGPGLTDEGGKVNLKDVNIQPSGVGIPNGPGATAPGSSFGSVSAAGPENELALRIGFALAALVFLGVAYWGAQLKVPPWPIARSLEVAAMSVPCVAIAIWPVFLLWILIGGFVAGGILILKNTGLAAAAEDKAKSYREATRAALDGVNRLPNAAQAHAAIASAAEGGDMAVITKIQSDDGLVNHMLSTQIASASPAVPATAKAA